MKKIFNRRLVTVDPGHMTTLHQEAIEQLELMHSVMAACEHAADGMSDTLTSIATNHWEAYLDVIHMICMHDENFAAVMKKQGVLTHETELAEPEQRQFYSNRMLVVSLLLALMRRHRRFSYFYALRANPMGDYIKESVAMERNHIIEIIDMVQNLL